MYQETRTTAPLGTLPVREERREAELPVADRRVRHRIAAPKEQLGDIPEPELVLQAPDHGPQHNVRRVLEIVEGRTGPLVEAPSAGPASEPPVPSAVRSLPVVGVFERQRGQCIGVSSSRRERGHATDTSPEI